MDSGHVCEFKPVRHKKNTFKCSICKAIHECGDDKCDSLFYNNDYTNVCIKTGLCFEQRICETYVDTKKSMNGLEQVYIKKTKRDQQIKNKILERLHVSKIIKCASSIVYLNEDQINILCKMILSLWEQFVINITQKQEYVHRKDKRCFVVAIIMSLQKGIMTDDENFIVKPHPKIKTEKLNKKSEYGEFSVSDIRYGQTLIKRVFNGVKIDPSKCITIST